jgi:two-component system, cell cycle sensor histidine kinase and response regulator CckA
MAARYTDIEIAKNGAIDFVVRQRTPTIMQLMVMFFAFMVVSVSALGAISDRTHFLLTLTLVMGLIGWYVIVQMMRNRDLLLATEFQNALFASALGLHNKFCMIIRRNGNIVYLDRKFQEMFPDFVRYKQRSIDLLLEQGNVSTQDKAKISTAIERGVYEKVIFDIKGTGSNFTKVVMSIEPILRPNGFTLLRGREFIESRRSQDPTANAGPAGMLNQTTITLFSHVMDTMNMGVYMTGPDGNIIYANPVLENWLGYGEGEITSRNLSLQDIVHQNSERPATVVPDNFEGDVMLQKKTGGMMKSFVNQKIIYDQDKKVMGCTAIVHHFVDQTEKANKKPW